MASSQPPQYQPPRAASPRVRKVFRAYSLDQVMQQVRGQLGPRALIVSSKMLPSAAGDPGMVEVVAEVAQEPAKAMPDPLQTPPEIGGLGKPLAAVREVIILPLKFPEMFERLGVPPPKGVLMYGPPGCGKTLIARTLARESGANFISVSGPELMQSALGEAEKQMREVFEKAAQQSPALIFFDEIDAIAGKREDSSSGTEKRLVTQLLTLLDGVSPRGRLLVLAATNLPDAIDPALRRPGRFDREVEIPVPDPQGRMEILQIHTRQMALAPDVNVKELVEATHGFVGADLASLCKEAGMRAIREAMPSGAPPPTALQVCQRHFQAALAEMRPSLMRGSANVSSTITWEDVGGLENVKQELMEAIMLPLKRPELLQRMDIKPPRGVLLAGPPGTGKTLIAKAAAGECGVNFIPVNGPSLVSKFVGESEKGIREVFARARQAAPCIIFFDEFDSIAPVRGTDAGENQSGNRLVAQLLVEMDGFDAAEGVFCLAATNRPDAIDPALLRPGRFDKVIEIPLPDADSRRKILQVHLRHKPIEKHLNIENLVKATEGMSGAEIEEACRRAAMDAVRGVISGSGRLEPTISQTDLHRAFSSIYSSKGVQPAHVPVAEPKALVLDDEFMPRELASEILQSIGFKVTAFDDPLKALDAAEKEGFDLAVLDINMPKMNGLEVLAKLREMFPNLPVIMATGQTEAAFAVNSFHLGAVDYLTKPYSVADLTKAAKEAMEPVRE